MILNKEATHLAAAALAFQFQQPLLQQLPRKLDEAIERGLLVEFKLPKHNLYILGTVHIGNESANEAALLIDAVRPSTVIVELSPSRLEKIVRTRRQVKSDGISKKADLDRKRRSSTTSPSTTTILFDTIPQLAMKGWEYGGLGGMLFSAGMIGGTLLKQAWTMNDDSSSDDDDDSIRRRDDEFEASIIAADTINATIIPADYEFDELIKEVSKAMTPFSWLRVGIITLLEQIGLYPKDPIVRQRDETFHEWENRRRNIATARSSRIHGEKSCVELSRVLVDARDDRFAKCCIEALTMQQQQRQKQFSVTDTLGDDDGGGGDHGIISTTTTTTSPDGTDVAAAVVCVVVGLAHLDGIVRRIEENIRQ